MAMENISHPRLLRSLMENNLNSGSAFPLATDNGPEWYTRWYACPPNPTR